MGIDWIFFVSDFGQTIPFYWKNWTSVHLSPFTFISYYFISRPRRRQGLLYKHICDSFINSLGNGLCKYLHGAATSQWLNMGLFFINKNMLHFLGNYKSWTTSKLHNCFKSYFDFAECMDFAYWLSFSGEGSASCVKSNRGQHSPKWNPPPFAVIK